MNQPVTIPNAKGQMLTVGLFLLAIGGISFYAYSQGKKKPTIKGTNVGGEESAGRAFLETLAQKIHEDVSGLTFVNDVDIFQTALSLSDNDFTRLYNIYNTLYQSESAETMTAAVSDEFAWILNYEFMVVKDQFVSRCASLDLP